MVQVRFHWPLGPCVLYPHRTGFNVKHDMEPCAERQWTRIELLRYSVVWETRNQKNRQSKRNVPKGFSHIPANFRGAVERRTSDFKRLVWPNGQLHFNSDIS